MAFLLLSLAAGLGGFFPHHFVFAVPGYAALSFVCTANASRKSYAFFPLFVAMLTVGTLLNPPKMDTTIPDSAATLQERGIWRAHVIDSTLEECNVDRYMIVGGLVTQTTHSPLGPFSYYGHMVDRPDSHFAKIAQENLEQASIVIADTTPPRNPLEQSRYDYLTRHFTPTPPSCAMTLSHVGNDQPEFTMFFRE
jgi:hypothetical protein